MDDKAAYMDSGMDASNKSGRPKVEIVWIVKKTVKIKSVE